MYTKFFTVFLILTCFVFQSNGQYMYKPSSEEIKKLPTWAQKMYADDANFNEVTQLYNAYHVTHPFVKTYHTKYYQRWKRKVQPFVQSDGSYTLPSAEQILAQNAVHARNVKEADKRSATWSLLGPVQVFESEGKKGHTQTNIYSIEQSPTQPNIMYCGTEPGEVYKSIDKGATWINKSMAYNFGGGVSAVETVYDNADVVIAGSGLGIFRSEDGGDTWANVLTIDYRNIGEIFAHPSVTSRIFATTDEGLFISEDQGLTWAQRFTEKCYDIKCHPVQKNIMYLVKNSPSRGLCEFFKSTDTGLTWQLQSDGWFDTDQVGRNDGGVRLAVSDAAPDMVYAYLIGEAKTGDLGFIGLYRSENAGETWESRTGEPGGPYSDEHPNLAIGWPGWDYHQGFYNCAVMVSNQNADDVLVGGLNLWRSRDGGLTWAPHAGYRGGPLNMHVDNQDMRALGNDYWVTTDGGTYHSTDFFETQPEFMMHGVHGSDYWGFGSGWNEDVLVGGLYHNGNLAAYERYTKGDFLALGGGEAPTGYVNPGNNRKTYFSDIGGKIIPLNMADPVSSFSFGKSPNESYWSAASSEMEFDPSCYNIAYLGNGHKLWKTEDGGSNFFALHTFGTNEKDLIQQIEISRSTPDVIYCTQQFDNGSNGRLWRTLNNGSSWNSLNIPSGNSHRMLITLDPLDHQVLWLAYPSGNNGQKIFKTTDGGATWTNMTTDIINNQEGHSLVHIGGTNGGVYYGSNQAIYYRNNDMTDWELTADGLPTFLNCNILRPFYRDSKIRVASYGKGIWEAAMEEQSTTIIPQAMVDKLKTNVLCKVDSFYFEDYSMANHEGLTWNWTFEGGSPATSDKRNPSVFFETDGAHEVSMSITDAQGNIYKDTLSVQVQYFKPTNELSEGFEAAVYGQAWLKASGPNGGEWSIADTGAFGTSAFSAVFKNYDYDAKGGYSDIQVKTSFASLDNPVVRFDVAYAQYGFPYTDTLEVLVSLDCGETFTSHYYNGGQSFATADNSDKYFIPTAEQWRTDSIDLSVYSGQSDVLIAFRNHGNWGNNIYLDNINLNGTISSTTETAKDFITIYPNPAKAGQNLTIQTKLGDYKVSLSGMDGKVIWQGRVDHTSSIKLPENLVAGSYVLNFRNENHIANKVILIW